MAGLGRRSHYRKHLTDAVLHDLPEPDGIGQRIARVVGTRGGNMFDVIVAPPISLSNKEPADLEIATNDVAACEKMVDREMTSKPALDGNGKQLPMQSTETASKPPLMRNAQRTPQLAFLPTKFRKLVWIKRNDFVIVECGDEEDEGTRHDQKDSSSGGGGFRYVISHILYKDQLKHIKSKGLWPLDPFFNDEMPSSDAGNGEGSETKIDQQEGGEGEPEHSLPDDNKGKDNEPQSQYDGAYEDNGIVFDDPLGDEYMVNTNRLAKLCVEDSSSEEDSD